MGQATAGAHGFNGVRVPFRPAIGDSPASTTKEKVVSFPLEAFVRVDAPASACGSFCLLGGEWAFRCRFEPEDGPIEQVLWLTGDNKGLVSAVPNAAMLTLAPEYNIQIRVDSPQKMNEEYQSKAGVIEIMSDGGIEFWGSKWGAPHYLYAFDFAGAHVGPGERPRPMLTFDAYDCWLHKDGGVVGDGPLFTVSPR